MCSVVHPPRERTQQMRSPFRQLLGLLDQQLHLDACNLLYDCDWRQQASE